MNTRIFSASSLAAICLLAAVVMTLPVDSSGQTFPAGQSGRRQSDPAPVPPPQAGVEYRATVREFPVGPNVPGFHFTQLSPDDPRLPSFQKLGELKGTLQNAADDEKEAVIAELETTLGEYFDRDMEHRQSELQRLTERADETEALNERRLESRTELIDLQYQAFVQEAGGLEGLTPTPTQGWTYAGPNLPLPAPVPYAQGAGARTVVVAPGRNGGTAYGIVSDSTNVRQEAMNRIHQARQNLAAAADVDAETMAQSELQAALGEYFDADMEYRTNELANIRTGLTEMESKVEERAAAKADIIAIQLKMIVNESDGLGFFSGGDFGGGFNHGGFGVPGFPAVSPPAGAAR